MNDNKSNNRTKTIKARLSESEYQAISEQRQASGQMAGWLCAGMFIKE